QLDDLVREFKSIVQRETGKPFPIDPQTQLRLAIEAVFGSWFGKRAVDYRNTFKISNDLGTACSVVTMVFGNMGEDSGTGVAFTRDPNTGQKVLYGEYLTNAQGEDVVAGLRTPSPISQMKSALPKAYAEFETIAKRLEKHYRDAQDLEFTIERGKLYMLQTRSAKRTAAAAVKIATDMVREGLITKDEAIRRVDPMQVEQLLLPRFDQKEVDRARGAGRFLAKGLNASPGAATGRADFDADRAVSLAGQKELVVLVRPETSPDDSHGMVAATGLLHAGGSATSHAAVMARELGAEGVGLARTEHMFRQADRLPIVQDMIMADDLAGRQKALDKLLPFQQGDFREMYEAMDGLPVVIRLIDPPLHEFLREYADLNVDIAVARASGNDGPDIEKKARIYRRLQQLHEANPMLGLRGCRLLLVYPEILEMQIRAILGAAIDVSERGIKAKPEIMMPLVGTMGELDRLQEQVMQVAETVFTERGKRVAFKFGTMIEIPRACLIADEIAGKAEFFSFGTNDLTQTVLGISRDDAQKSFLTRYVE